MWEYSEKLKDHFFNPRNVGRIDDADAVGEVGSIACGDALKIYLKIRDGVIVDVKFETFGCGSAIASASALTEMIKGKTIEEARKITNKDIAEYLGGLPPQKMHCSVMGWEALDVALKNYEGKGKGVEHVEKEDEGRIVCHCFGVPEGLIKKAIVENDLKSVEEITNYTKAGGGCGSCIMDLEEILKETRREMEFENKVKKCIESEIRPMLMRDGGDVEIVKVEGEKVYLKLKGMCAHCPSSTYTLKAFVEAKLKESVSENLEVLEG